MKKAKESILFSSIALILTISAQSQAINIAVFDIDSMVCALPEYKRLDTLISVNEYILDRTGYDSLTRVYKTLDSLFVNGIDLLPKGKATLRDSIAQLRQEIAPKLIYWMEIVRANRIHRLEMLSKPLYETVTAAFTKVIGGKQYALILKPKDISRCEKADNLFAEVARELNIVSLPESLLHPSILKPF